MGNEQHKRRRRTPLTQEEVEGVIAFKKRKEELRLSRLKKSWSYKLQNIFNVLCFFIFCELLLCYSGPCNYHTHYADKVSGLYGEEFKSDGTPIVAEIDVICLQGKTYKFIINDYIEIPPSHMSFRVGSDYLLRKELKGSFGNSDTSYRIFSASPVLFLSAFTSFIMLLGIGYNLNENEYSLMGLTLICAMTLLCVLFM